MNLREIEERVAAIEPRPGVEFLEALLLAYGFSRMSVARLMSGSTDKAETAYERLLKNKVYFRFAEVDDDELYALIDAARDDDLVIRHKPRFLIVKNEQRLLASDQETGETLDVGVEGLPAHTTFFLPWAGIEKTRLENVNYADVKAAEKMAKLYDEVTKHNSIETEKDVHDLNVFFSRLLFCFFAEDTGVFESGSFTNAIGSYTGESGEDTHSFLDELFDVLDRKLDDRDDVPGHLKGFGYVNGNLFARRCRAPRFSVKARAVILECGTLDWSQINPSRCEARQARDSLGRAVERRVRGPRGLAEGAYFVSGDVRPNPGLATWLVSKDAFETSGGVIVTVDPAARAVSDFGVVGSAHSRTRAKAARAR